MFTLENGILKHDGVSVLGIGQSYFASYHPQKVPVRPEDDVIGQMKQDLTDMKEAGFNICRIAALGEVKATDEGVTVDFPIPDAFCDDCRDLDMAAMVRLQGYDFNLHGYTDAVMLNSRGEEMPFHWSWFVRNCLCHEGIYADNVAATKKSAEHFSSKPSVVSFQIYNEPAYPNKGLYDYNPKTTEAFFKRTGHQAPRKRPETKEDAALWTEWKLFLLDCMEGFLCDMSDCAAGAETLTCHTTAPFMCGAATRAQDYFQTAERMSILGITHYIVCRWPDFHQAALSLDAAESIAALFGKHAWLIEYNARTNISAIEFQRETYAALGRGLKGIMYYQWRADYPYPGSPEPEAFGMVFNNRKPVAAYDTEIEMIKLLNRFSTSFATAEKRRSSVGLLYSVHANAWFDGLDNRDCDGSVGAHERSIISLNHAYRELNEAGIVPDLVRTRDLASTPLSLKTLIVYCTEGLSEKEKDEIDAFPGRVFEYDDDLRAFYEYRRNPERRLHGIVYPGLQAADLGLESPVVADCPQVDARLVENDREILVCLVNYAQSEKPVTACRVTLSALDGNPLSGRFFSLEYPEGVCVGLNNSSAVLPEFTAGGILVIEKQRKNRQTK